ncbi:MAG TPA: HAD-IA family hydrolase [Vicinamibacteria bacterium]
MALEAIFLDAGGVLVNPNWVRVSETLARAGVLVEPARLEAAEPRAKRDLDTAEQIRTTTDTSRGWDYFNLVLTHAGIALSAATDRALAELQEYHRRHNLWESVPAEVRPALASLRRLGLRLVVVSNSNGTLHEKLQRLGLLAAFDLVMDSFELGVEKPDPAIFTLALERLGAKAESTLHVGDFFHIDVVGARAAGLHAWLIDAAGLHADRDCPRFPTLTAVVEAVAAGRRP